MFYTSSIHVSVTFLMFLLLVCGVFSIRFLIIHFWLAKVTLAEFNTIVSVSLKAIDVEIPI